MADGSWVDRQAGRVTFTDYVEQHWWPRHLEISTRTAYRSNLDRHFLPFFGAYPLAHCGLDRAPQHGTPSSVVDALSSDT